MRRLFDLNPRNIRGKPGAETLISRQALLPFLSNILVLVVSMNIFKAVGTMQTAVIAEARNIRYSIFSAIRIVVVVLQFYSRWQPGKTGNKFLG